MIIQQKSGEATVVKPGCGGLQGDAAMAQEFSATYDPAIEKWLKVKEGRGLNIMACELMMFVKLTSPRMPNI